MLGDKCKEKARGIHLIGSAVMVQTLLCPQKKQGDAPASVIRSVRNLENKGILSVKTINESKSPSFATCIQNDCCNLEDTTRQR